MYTSDKSVKLRTHPMKESSEINFYSKIQNTLDTGIQVSDVDQRSVAIKK